MKFLMPANSYFPTCLLGRRSNLIYALLNVLIFIGVSGFGRSQFSLANEAPSELIYQGRIVKPDNSPLEAVSVVFDVSVFSQDGICLLYEETHTLNMANSGGSFVLPLGSGVPIGPTYSLKEVFSNTESFTGFGSCLYSPLTGHSRLLRVTFDEGSGPVALQDQTINSVPYALYASKLEGKGKSDFLQINTATSALSQANANSLFQNATYTELMALAGGTSTVFAKSADLPVSSGVLNLGGAGQGVRVLDVPAGGDYAVNKNYSDGKIGGKAIDATNFAGLANGESVKWDTTANSGLGGWVRYAPLSASGVVMNGGQAGAVSLGSSDANNLTLLTNGTARVTVDSASGNVGINTATPGYKLDVNGSLNATTFYLGGVLINLNNLSAAVTTTGGAVQTITQTATDAATATRGALLLRNNGTGSAANELNMGGANAADTLTSWIRQDGGAYFAGNVGIGTTNPSDTLDVAGSAKISGTLSATSTITSDVGLNVDFIGMNNDLITAKSSSVGVFYVKTVGGNGQLSLYDNSASLKVKLDSSGDSYLTGGNVGIGTATPGASLEVKSPSAAVIPIIVRSASAQWSGLDRQRWYSSAGGLEARITPNGGFYGLGDCLGLDWIDLGSGLISYCGGPLYLDNQGRDVLIPTGNLGIGVAVPGTKLQVAGVISPSADNTYSLGDATHRFSDVYSMNAANNTSDIREKKQILSSDLGLDFITKLRPVSYFWKSGDDQNQHYGLIAQETEQAIADSRNQPAENQKSVIVTYDKDSDRYGIRYTELISPVIKAIQELYAEVMKDREKIDSQARQIASKAEIAEISQLKAENAKLKADAEKQKQKNREMEARLDKIEKMIERK